jgi:hypothetical protein
MYPKCILKKDTYPWLRYISSLMAKVKIHMYPDVSRCILMYMYGTRQDTNKIHAGYITIHQDTYPIGTPPQKG